MSDIKKTANKVRSKLKSEYLPAVLLWGRQLCCPGSCSVQQVVEKKGAVGLREGYPGPSACPVVSACLHLGQGKDTAQLTQPLGPIVGRVN